MDHIQGYVILDAEGQIIPATFRIDALEANLADAERIRKKHEALAAAMARAIELGNRPRLATLTLKAEAKAIDTQGNVQTVAI